MAGKAYTMREMRAIVEYLTERKAYGEIRGRKMWMEFANSKHTVRTWQSLKETFLKRILPDLHNPYYKLSADEVRSFRQGYDVAERERNNRLEFRTASEDSSTNADNQDVQTIPQPDDEVPTTAIVNEPSTSIDKELENATGEDITSAKIQSRNRSSADTVVLEYENAEEVLRVLESPNNDRDEPKTKSLKDLLTFEYTAPLTPIVREVLDDFETESEASDKEPGLSIVENSPENREPQETAVENTTPQQIATENTPSDNDANDKVESAIGIQDTEDADVTQMDAEESTDVIKDDSVANETAQRDIQGKSHESQENESNAQKRSEENHKENNNNDQSVTPENDKESSVQNNDVSDSKNPNNTEFVTALESSNAKTIKTPPVSRNIKEINITIYNTAISTQNTENTSSDTILPNNQEALDDPKKANLEITGDNSEKVENSLKRSEKRAASQDNRDSKKLKTSDITTDESKIDGGNTTAEIIEIDLATQNTSCDINATLNSDVIVMNTDTPTNNTEEGLNAQSNAVSKNSDKTNKTRKGLSMNKVKNIDVVKDKVIEKDVGTNPCLQSVSLFEEQFKNIKYSDSDSDDEATPAPKVIEIKDIPQADKNEKKEMENKQVLQRKKEIQDKKDAKNVERTIESSGECQQRRQSVILTKQIQKKALSLQRERALANVFGFTHGAAASNNRKRRLSHRRRSQHQYHHRHSKTMDSNSSEWTSESDSESYISPPRGRKNRQTRKYLKPKSSRILQEPDEGMLYVIFGKNIYPLVKDGKHIKNLLTYRPDSGSDMEEESYWKQKYVDEKKRVDEYKRLMKETRENHKSPQTNERTSPRSPILPTSTSRKSTNAQPSGKTVQNENGKELTITTEVENKVEAKDDKMVLKIASKNGLECCLEGGWNQISNAMPEMVRMLQNNSSPNKEKIQPQESNKTEVEVQTSKDEALASSSEVARTLIDPEVHEKINKIETEIFKEIEMREKEEQDNENKTSNVTQRKRGRPRKDSSASSISAPRSPKKVRVSKTSSTESKQVATRPKNTRVSKQKLEVPVDIETKPDTEKPTTRTKTETLAETKDQEEMNTVDKKPLEKQQIDTTDQKRPVRRESLRISKQKEASEDNNRDSDASPVGTRSSARIKVTPKKYDTDSSASDIRLRSRKSASKETAVLLDFDDEEARFMFPPTATPKKSKTSPKGKRIRSLPEINVISPKEITEGNSIDSTQGYQDSDVSPVDQVTKRKRKISLLTRKKYKNRRVSRRKSYPTLLQELSSDSNNSSYFVPLKRSQSTLNSEVYKTDSYRLLLPKQTHLFNVLEAIDEYNPIEQQFDNNIRHFNSVSKSSDLSGNDNPNIVDINSSSNISLLVSPELSVVEKLSISREMIKSESSLKSNDSKHEMDFSEYVISNLDVSMPLMNQQCNVLNKNKGTPKNSAKMTTSSDPMLNKVCTVRVENLTLSESLNQRLRELLLESNKKMTRANSRKAAKKVDQMKASVNETNAYNTKENAMDVDEITTVTAKKTKAKRSSTPRKKKTAPKAKIPKDSVIEEEHRESCSYGGRKSCPPAVTFTPIDENANNCSDVTLNIEKVKKKKKDIIKVKIQRPKSKSRSREKIREKSVGNASTVSTYTDSGINDTETISGVLLKGSDDSVDLIHNHSETCLLANECIGDSMELIENTTSIISVNSSIESMDSELKRLLENTAHTSRELLFTTYARNTPASELRTSEEIFVTPESEYRSPAAINSSLLTEDLSDEPPNKMTKWYLLSEEDTNTLPETETHTYGANLKQLFPIICAVPDLSTISEISKENDSQKSHFDTDRDTRKCDTQSPF